MSNANPNGCFASDVIYAIDNKKHRAFIPSINNTFGGYQVKALMIDSGCNSHLLPIEQGSLGLLYNLFPPGDYTYTIGSSSGVAAVNSLTLIVEKRNGGQMEWRLASDINGGVIRNSAYLRFSICYDDAIDLRRDNMPSGLNIIGTIYLDKFIEHIDILRQSFPNMDFARRRHHALIGREISSRIKHSTIMKNDITVIGPDDIVSAICSMSFADLMIVKNRCMNLATANVRIDGLSFNDLEDEYNDDLEFEGEFLDS
jgi:hypothetical protein